MAVPIGFIEASYIWQAVGLTRELVNVIGYELGPTASIEPNVIATDLYADWQLSLKAQQDTEITFARVDVRKGAALGDLLGTFSGAITGTSASDYLPVNTSVLVKKVTNAGGRINQGRMYLPGFCAEVSTNLNGQMSSAEVSSIQGVVTAWYDANVANDYLPVILHSGGETPTPVTAYQVNPLLATQRRRMRG